MLSVVFHFFCIPFCTRAVSSVFGVIKPENRVIIFNYLSNAYFLVLDLKREGPAMKLELELFRVSIMLEMR